MSNEESFSQVKVKKMRKTPHYLTSTANTRAKRQTKFSNRASPTNTKKSAMAKTEEPKSKMTLWIEDLPIEELKLEYNHFKVAYKEYIVLHELTILALKEHGIFIADRKNDSNSGILKSDFDEFEGEEEDLQQVMEEGEESDDHIAQVQDYSGSEDNEPRKNAFRSKQ